MFYDALPFIDKLTESEREILETGVHCAFFEKGQMIHYGTTDCVGLIYVESGSIRVYMTSEEGREITLFRLSPGEVCVLSASCVLEAIDFDVSIVADAKTEVKQLDVATFAKLSASNVYVELFGYRTATERFSDVMWAMQQILFTSFDRRLAMFLVEERQKNAINAIAAGIDNQINPNVISMTHEEIARNLGSAREVVSRMLKYFEKENLVALSKGKVEIINESELKKI